MAILSIRVRNSLANWKGVLVLLSGPDCNYSPYLRFTPRRQRVRALLSPSVSSYEVSLIISRSMAILLHSLCVFRIKCAHHHRSKVHAKLHNDGASVVVCSIVWVAPLVMPFCSYRVAAPQTDTLVRVDSQYMFVSVCVCCEMTPPKTYRICIFVLI